MESRRRGGVSILEMLVTLLIVALLIAAAVEILQNTGRQIRQMTGEMTQRALIQASLDKLMTDISLAGKDQATLQVKNDASSWYESSRVTIEWPDVQGGEAYKRIDWAAAPDKDEAGLILYRRVKIKGSQEDAYFIPLCENLYSFQVQLAAGGEASPEDPNRQQMVDIVVESYRDRNRDPERLLVVSRTFCRERLE